MNQYTVRLLPDISSVPDQWETPFWKKIPSLPVSHFRKESSEHRPPVEAKMVCGPAASKVLFRVSDQYVRSTRTRYNSDVWNDSCVEWFVRPKSDKGYFNFEVNCGGTLHVSYIEDPERLPGGALKKSTPLPPEIAESVEIFHSLPATVTPEVTTPLEWFVTLTVPFAVFESFIGSVGPLDGQQWRANFNKCADQTSHPHWATWSPVSELNFHRPQEFGTLTFERAY
jgi:hypothetical protein